MSVQHPSRNLFMSKLLYGTLAVIFMLLYGRRRAARWPIRL
jgi:hypothetical protein